MSSGVYAIINKNNLKLYIGSSVDIERRKRDHFNRMEKGKHHNYYLQAIYNKYGPEGLEFKILERCKKEKLKEREQYYINRYNSSNYSCGYNISLDTTAPMRGKQWTEKQRQSHYETHVGKHMSEEAKRNMSIAHIGKSLGNGLNVSLEEREKRRERMRLTNSRLTPEQRLNANEKQKETKKRNRLEGLRGIKNLKRVDRKKIKFFLKMQLKIFKKIQEETMVLIRCFEKRR